MYYTAEQADTIISVAEKFGLEPERLAYVNCLNVNDVIESGHIIYIPNFDVDFNKLDMSLNDVTREIVVADAYPLPPIYFEEFENYLNSMEEKKSLDATESSLFDFYNTEGIENEAQNSCSLSESSIDPKPRIIGIISPYASNVGLACAIQNVACASHLTYCCGKINAEGSLVKEVLPDILCSLKNLGANVIGCITNFIEDKYCELKKKCMFRTELSDEILTLISDNNFSGILFDIKPLDLDNIVSLSKIISEIKLNSAETKIYLSVTCNDMLYIKDVFTEDIKIRNTYLDNIDLFVIQLFKCEKEPSPISPLLWFSDNLDYAISLFGKERVSASIGAYGLDWSILNNELKMMNYDEISQIESDIERHLTQDGVNICYCVDQDVHNIWHENETSIAMKLDILKSKGVESIALFRLGNISKEITMLLREF